MRLDARQLSAAEITNLWHHWWAGHMAAVGGTSLLPLAPLPEWWPGPEALDEAEPEALEPEPEVLEPEPEVLEPEPEVLEPAANRKQRRQNAHVVRRATSKVRRARTVEHREPVAEAAPSQENWQTPEMADWAKELLANERNQHTTVEDLLEGIDDYFELFDKLRRKDGDIYRYFSGVGTPIALRNIAVYEREIVRLKIPNADRLPSKVGTFVPRTKADYREDIIHDRPAFFDFEFFEKLTKNYATAAPPGTTIFRHNVISLGREAFSRQELKKYPCARGCWGASWLVGVLPDGSVKALPCQMSLQQKLPNGDVVHHSGMMVPPGLQETKKGPDFFVRVMFNLVLAMTTSALSGVQVTLRRRGNSVRIGLPITNMRAFFGDREPDADSGRRGQILHLRRPHLRRLANGREIVVREHLRGERFFRWNDCDITIGVPGIHHAAVEAFTAGAITDEDRNYAQWDKKDLTTIGYLADVMRAEVWTRRKPTIRRGQPTIQFAKSRLNSAPPSEPIEPRPTRPVLGPDSPGSPRNYRTGETPPVPRTV